jgi:hypothetical protein
MLVRSQDNQKITDRIEFLIAEIPVTGEYGIYQPDHYRLFGRYSTMRMAIKALDMLEEHFNEPVYYNVINKNETERYEHTVFQFPAESEIEDEE